MTSLLHPQGGAGGNHVGRGAGGGTPRRGTRRPGTPGGCHPAGVGTTPTSVVSVPIELVCVLHICAEAAALHPGSHLAPGVRRTTRGMGGTSGTSGWECGRELAAEAAGSGCEAVGS